MAYWTVTGDKRNDAAKGREWRAHLAQTDWDKIMRDLEKEADKAHDIFIGKSLDRQIERLRRDWINARNNKYFVEHGVQHPSCLVAS
jgi:hypothetical protein